MRNPNRREFVKKAAFGVSAVAAIPETVFGQAPAVMTKGVKPLVIASSNGHKFKNGGPQTCVEKAFSMITAGSDEVYLHGDGWSISTEDGSLAAHFEHTVAITADGPRILTPRVGIAVERAKLLQ